MCAARAPLRRRASTPLPCAHQIRLQNENPIMEVCMLPPPQPTPDARGGESPESEITNGAGDGIFRVVLLGDPGVGKTSLVGIFRREQDRETSDQQQEFYKCTMSVDGEDTSLLLMDICEVQKPDGVSDSAAMRVGHAYILVYSVTDRCSFESASELRIQLRRTRQYENIPIILVGNKTDLVRSREVSVEEGRACAVVFDCKFIETSAVLQHNVRELFEGMVRQIRLRRDGPDAAEICRLRSQRKESLSKRARRFLDRIVTRNSKTVLKVHSRSCHDLSVL
ncbi:PREDICTED: GTP-binding protein REM 1 [Nanorana parkeri]|uniref:GTP-binding protein REM 1 n=1 Tax=Nanorana parkeri TaxID=125878 RepID=UPI000854CDF0|nr:PREDICTED: GTP-binding protein REM 1 [Nanorana parkeri]